MEEADSGGGLWGLLDKAVDGVTSTGVSVFEGAGSIAEKYQAYRTKLGLDAPAATGAKAPAQLRPEHTVSKADDLNRAEFGSPAWYQQPGYLFTVIALSGVLILLLRKL